MWLEHVTCSNAVKRSLLCYCGGFQKRRIHSIKKTTTHVCFLKMTVNILVFFNVEIEK